MSAARGGAEGVPMSSRRAAWFWGGISTGAAPYLLAITMAGRAAQNMGQTTYPLIARQLLDVGNGTLGAMPAAAGLAAVVTAATLAARATSTSAWAMLTAGQSLIFISFVLLALPTGVAGLWTGALLLGVGGGLAMPTTMTMIGSAPVERRARALAVYALSLSAGLVVGPLLESGVLHLLSGSLRAAFAAMLPLPLLATLLSAIAWRRRPALGQGSPGSLPELGVDEGAGREAGAGVADPLAHEPGLERRAGLLRYSAYRLALATQLTYQAPFAAVVTFGALLARRVDGTSAAGASLAFTVFFTVSLAFRSAVVASPTRHRRFALVASVLATAAGLAVLGGGRGVTYLLVGMAVLGAPHGLTFSLASGILAEGVPPQVLGRANSRLLASTNLATIAVPFACGWLAGSLGYRAMFLTLEVPTGVFGGILLLALRRPLTGGRRRRAGGLAATDVPDPAS